MTDYPSPRIAYFSMEIGLESEMPTYSGGLGVLAGDTLRAAADLGLPVVGISLLYRQGYFRQRLDVEGNQTETPYRWDPLRYLVPLDVRMSVTIDDRNVALRPLVYNLPRSNGGNVPVYFLDADLPENEPEDRALTGYLYGGDRHYRLRQEALLGLGGLALLRALGHNQIETYHMNEGHCAFLTVGLLAEGLGEEAEATEEQLERVRQACVFTTHTPVPAGQENFPFYLVREVIGWRLGDLLERMPCINDGMVNMTQLALFLSRYVNGVARRHGEVSQAMFPGYQINSITNGVHAATWTSPAFSDLFDREIPGWRADSAYLRRALNLRIEEVQAAHAEAKRELFEVVEQKTGFKLNPATMTIGFARRVAAYKRADLVFADLEHLRTISREAGPLQLIFAGKAHPDDEPAKSLIRRIFEMRDQLHDDLSVVYLEEHDMNLGRLLCAGVDLWLNNPQKPLEASGTSGMKAALNGVPSFSVLDGWWPEGWIEGVTGWSIGGEKPESDAGEELESLYTKLRHVILPLYYGSPGGYARVMRSTIAVNGAYFTAQRMVQQYSLNAYRLHQPQEN